MRLTVDKSTFEVRASAFTLILYEDTFKGRRFLRDVSALLESAEDDDIPVSVALRLVWALAKTADPSIPDCAQWSMDFSIAGIAGAVKPALELIAESMTATKKSKAAAVRERVCQRLISWLTRRNAG